MYVEYYYYSDSDSGSLDIERSLPRGVYLEREAWSELGDGRWYSGIREKAYLLRISRCSLGLPSLCLPKMICPYGSVSESGMSAQLLYKEPG